MSAQDQATAQANTSPTKEALIRRVDNDFSYHRPPATSQVTFEALRYEAKVLARMLVEVVPPGRELATALTKLEECVMHANAGIARQFPVQKPELPS